MLWFFNALLHNITHYTVTHAIDSNWFYLMFNRLTCIFPCLAITQDRRDGAFISLRCLIYINSFCFSCKGCLIYVRPLFFTFEVIVHIYSWYYFFPMSFFISVTILGSPFWIFKNVIHKKIYILRKILNLFKEFYLKN